MTYTTVSISEEVKKELAIIKVMEDMKTYEELFALLIENYKNAKGENENAK